MKTRIVIISFVLFFTVSFLNVYSQEPKKEEKSKTTAVSPASKSNEEAIKVSGQCDMCQKRIEAAAVKVPGVASAKWNESKQILYVKYTKEPKSTEVQRAVADAGYDTQKFKAPDKAYNALPACCRYRK